MRQVKPGQIQSIEWSSSWARIKRKWSPQPNFFSSGKGLCQHWDRWLPQRIHGKNLSREIHILGAACKRPQRSEHLGDLNPLSPLSDPRHHLIRKATIMLIMGLLLIIYCSDELWTSILLVGRTNSGNRNMFLLPDFPQENSVACLSSRKYLFFVSNLCCTA